MPEGPNRIEIIRQRPRESAPRPDTPPQKEAAPDKREILQKKLLELQALERETYERKQALEARERLAKHSRNDEALQKHSQKEARDEEKDEKPKDYARRTALVGFGSLLGLVGANAVGQYVENHYGKRISRDIENAQRHPPHPHIAREAEITPYAEHFVVPPALVGTQVGGLEVEFLGLAGHGHLPKELDIDYPSNLAKMWDEKVHIWEPRLKKRHKTIDPNVLEMRTERMTEYQTRWRELRGPNGEKYENRKEALGRTTLEEAAEHIDKMIDDLKSHIRPKKLQEIYGLSNEQMRVVGTLAVNIDSKLVDAQGMLAAYSMTELLPKWDGAANAAFYDFLLQTAGKEFMANIPSMGDPATSFGPLQFTAEALGHSIDPHSGKTVLHGASVANQAVDAEYQLPDSLDKVHDFIEHFKAGYLFAVNNIAVAARQCYGETLEKFGKMDKESLLEFMSASHNNPSLADQALKLYLERQWGFWGSSWLNSSYIDCCTAIDNAHAEKLKKTGRHVNALVRIDEYSQKTIANFTGLRGYLGTNVASR